MIRYEENMKTGLLKVFAGVMTAAMLLSNVVAYAEEATDTTSGNVSGEVSEEESGKRRRR